MRSSARISRNPPVENVRIGRRYHGADTTGVTDAPNYSWRSIGDVAGLEIPRHPAHSGALARDFQSVAQVRLGVDFEVPGRKILSYVCCSARRRSNVFVVCLESLMLHGSEHGRWSFLLVLASSTLDVVATRRIRSSN